MKATDDVAPKAFWTDSEPGLINAASHVFPTTPHFYCLFHIWQNIIKHLKTKLGTKFHSFSKVFYTCRNTLSTELFEEHWETMMREFPESQSYMTRTLYSNRLSWAKSYSPFQFNAGVQSTQSVESFNAVIKKAVNSASTLCDVEKAINKRHETESQYCKLVDLKAQQTTVGLPHLSSQFFSTIDAILVHFLTPLVLSWQRFQISQSFTYEGQLVSSFVSVSNVIKFSSRSHVINTKKIYYITYYCTTYTFIIQDLESDTINEDFIENVVDEPQITLQSLLDGIEHARVIETWRVRRIGGISQKENLVILLDDGTHLCTCAETITKGIICRHFWRVMLYTNAAKFHISIIPSRWYKDSILTNLDINVKNSSILAAVESNDQTFTSQNNFTLQSLHNFQGVEYDKNETTRQNNPKRNRFGVAFSTAKVAVNVALETNSDHELVQILKDFIAAKREDERRNNHNNTEDNDVIDEAGDIVPLQKNLIEKTTNPNVTRIRGAPSKRRLKSALESSKRKAPVQEILKENVDIQPIRQRKCLLCGKPGHYQKKCPGDLI
jgi:hypothetical protein